jgi:hypothetical protein
LFFQILLFLLALLPLLLQLLFQLLLFLLAQLSFLFLVLFQFLLLLLLRLSFLRLLLFKLLPFLLALYSFLFLVILLCLLVLAHRVFLLETEAGSGSQIIEFFLLPPAFIVLHGQEVTPMNITPFPVNMRTGPASDQANLALPFIWPS